MSVMAEKHPIPGKQCSNAELARQYQELCQLRAELEKLAAQLQQKHKPDLIS